jgi:ribonuclease HII
MTIVGIDEAGRGPLAGPVAVGVVAVSESFDILAAFPGLNDSKKLTQKKREALYELLLEEGKKGNLQAKVCFASEKTIDTRGIVYAVTSALVRGITALAPEPENHFIYLDGSLKAPKSYSQQTVIGGDGTIPSIMLASVAAKVVRDRLMERLSHEYPEYGFSSHKGYGTKTHYAALTKHGPCKIHRRSYLKLK